MIVAAAAEMCHVGPSEGIYPQIPLGAPMLSAVQPVSPFAPQSTFTDRALPPSSELPADAATLAPLQAPGVAMLYKGVAVPAPAPAPAPDVVGDSAASPLSAFYLAPEATPLTSVVGPAPALTPDQNPSASQASAPLTVGPPAFPAAPVPDVAPAMLPTASFPSFLPFAVAPAVAAPTEMLPTDSPNAAVAASPTMTPDPALSVATPEPSPPAVAAVSKPPRQTTPPAYAVQPVIRLVGPSPVVLKLGESYIDQGAVSNDADGMLQNNITHHILGEFLLDGISQCSWLLGFHTM